MDIKYLKNKKIRFFLLQGLDTGFFLFKEYTFGLLLNLIVDKFGFKLSNISVEIMFPFNKYIDDLYSRFEYFDEDVYVFYLENSYHTYDYGYFFLLNFLDKIKSSNKRLEIYVYSIKTQGDKLISIMKEYDFVKVIIRTDIEYFFNESFSNNKSLNEIDNLIYKDGDKIIETQSNNINYDLGEYIIGGHYSGYLDNYKLSKDYIISILDEDDKNTNDRVSHYWSKDKKIKHFRYRPDTTAMLTTGRGCKYNCSYCYRGVKYGKVRQIPLDIVKKDLDYLSEKYYEYIYLYDDCFLTTNANRLTELIDLMYKYDFYYGISIRYEMCKPEYFNLLKNIKFYRVQIGLQTISKDSNIQSGRNIDTEKFKALVKKFRDNGTIVSIDIIIGLPGETLKDFIRTFNFAVSLDPGKIHINKLFINPGTKLYDQKDEYGIKTYDFNNSLFTVPIITSSNTFSQKDLKVAELYVDKVAQKLKNTRILFR